MINPFSFSSILTTCKPFLSFLTLHVISQMLGPTDLLHASPAPHFSTFQVFLIYFPKHASSNTTQSYTPDVSI